MDLSIFIDGIIDKSAFPKVRVFENEHKKLGILRLVLGVIILVRFSEISYSGLVLGLGWDHQLVSISFLLLVLGFTLGFCTQLISLVLFISVRFFDQFFKTGTLGTLTLQWTLIPFILVNSGYYYSLDWYFLKKNNCIGRVLKWINSFLGVKNVNEITATYFLAFFGYGLISLAAVQLHLGDDTWLAGMTVKSLMLNPYFNKYFEFFQYLDHEIPALLSSISIGTIIIQSFFQLFMIPLLFLKIGQKFVFYWGLVFFGVSLVFINLSYLPHIEIVLWAMVFLPVETPRKTVEVFYDDHCNLCKKSIGILKSLDIRDKIIYLPLSKNYERVRQLVCTKDKIKTDSMVGVVNDKVYTGYQLYTKICFINPLLYVLIPIFIIGECSKIGPLVYDFFSKYRHRIFGTCEFSFANEYHKKKRVVVTEISKYFTNLVYVSLCILSVLFILNIFYLHSRRLNNVIRSFGGEAPNVFNSVDLEMGDIWMEIYRVEKEKLVQVPISGKNGRRLSYSGFDILNFTNYNSDLIYYGMTVPFRRKIKRNSVADSMMEGNFGWENLELRLRYDNGINRFEGEHRYLVRIYHANASDVSYQSTNQDIFIPQLIFEKTYVFAEGLLSSADPRIIGGANPE